MIELAPNLSEILRHFSPDLPWLVALAGISAAYLLGARRATARTTANRHAHWRSGCFLEA
ncbi:MAG: hypothetical protein ABI939_07890 [Anaerolineaceae bacterium]